MEKLILNFILLLKTGRKVAPEINHKNIYWERKEGHGVSITDAVFAMYLTPFEVSKSHPLTSEERKAISVHHFSLSFRSKKQTKNIL